MCMLVCVRMCLSECFFPPVSLGIGPLPENMRIDSILIKVDENPCHTHTHTRTHHPPDKTPPSLGLGWWVLVIQLSCSLHARSIKVSVTLYEARGLPSNCILPFRGHNQMQLPNHITTLRFNLCSPDAKGWETETHLSELINWLKHRWVNWNSKQQKCS